MFNLHDSLRTGNKVLLWMCPCEDFVPFHLYPVLDVTLKGNLPYVLEELMVPGVCQYPINQ